MTEELAPCVAFVEAGVAFVEVEVFLEDLGVVVAAVLVTVVAVGFVVDFNATTKVLRYIQPQFTDQGIDSNQNLTAFSTTATVTGATSGATGTPSLHDTTPELTHDTGDILYIENRKPISRASDQTENVKLIVEF